MVKQIARKKSFLMAFKATALSFLWYLFSIQLNKQYLQFKKNVYVLAILYSSIQS